MKHSGFTLSELLIALAILGVIATFTIPKVLQSQADQATKAKFLETYAALSEVNYFLFQNSIPESNYLQTLQERMNATRFCTDGLAEGCSPTSTNGTNYQLSSPSFLMPNGVMVGDLVDGGSALDRWDGVFIDLNGVEGPNLLGQDQFKFMLNYNALDPTFVREGTRAGQVGCSTNAAGSTNECLAMFD